MMVGPILLLKELFVILVLASVVFALARPIALKFCTPEDFARRRNTWLVLTIAAFVCPNFWVFSLLAIPVMIVAGLRDSSPAALYLLLLHVIPPMSLRVPMVGISYLLDIDNYLLLSFFVLTPAAMVLWRNRQRGSRGVASMTAVDLCLLAYGAVQSALYIRPINPDGTLVPMTAPDNVRRGFEFLFANALPYYVISRGARSRGRALELMSMFCLSCALMTGIALFEAAKHWLLYGDLAAYWGHAGAINLYLTRNASLRAMASSGHPLALGSMLVVAFGFSLCLRDYIQTANSRVAMIGLFWLGLLATYSRGPWMGAVFVYFAFALLRPRGATFVIKALGVATLVALVVSLTPLRERVVSVMPFLGGTVDYGNVLYRQLLAQRAWEIIQANPILGDQSALLKMLDLRQGQGIIDIINAYVQITLGSGLLGLGLFLAFTGITTFKLWRLSRTVARRDPATNLLGVCLLSCILGLLLLNEVGGFGTGVEKTFYVLIGLATAYVGWVGEMVRVPQAVPASLSRPARVMPQRFGQQTRLNR